MYSPQYNMYFMQPVIPINPYVLVTPSFAPIVSSMPVQPYCSPVIAPPPPRPGKAATTAKSAPKEVPRAASPKVDHTILFPADIIPKEPKELDALHTFVADKYKTNFCRSFEQGKPCPFGFNCMFAHSLEEKRTVEMNIQDGIITANDVEEFKHKGVISNLDHPDHSVLAERFKTQFCRSYEKKEICPYGHRCIFAHTPEEKRTLEMNIKDKLFTLEAIEAFKRSQPFAPLPPTVRVGNGPLVSIAPSVHAEEQGSDALPHTILLPDPTSFSESLLVTTEGTKKKKQRGRYKPHSLKRAASIKKATNCLTLAEDIVVPFAESAFGATGQTHPQSYDLNCSISGIMPTAELAPIHRSRPHSRSPQSESEHFTDEVSNSLLQVTVQALINLTAEDDQGTVTGGTSDLKNRTVNSLNLPHFNNSYAGMSLNNDI